MVRGLYGEFNLIRQPGAQGWARRKAYRGGSDDRVVSAAKEPESRPGVRKKRESAGWRYSRYQGNHGGMTKWRREGPRVGRKGPDGARREVGAKGRGSRFASFSGARYRDVHRRVAHKSQAELGEGVRGGGDTEMVVRSSVAKAV